MEKYFFSLGVCSSQCKVEPWNMIRKWKNLTDMDAGSGPHVFYFLGSLNVWLHFHVQNDSNFCDYNRRYLNGINLLKLSKWHSLSLSSPHFDFHLFRSLFTVFFLTTHISLYPSHSISSFSTLSFRCETAKQNSTKLIYCPAKICVNSKYICVELTMDPRRGIHKKPLCVRKRKRKRGREKKNCWRGENIK